MLVNDWAGAESRPPEVYIFPADQVSWLRSDREDHVLTRGDKLSTISTPPRPPVIVVPVGYEPVRLRAPRARRHQRRSLAEDERLDVISACHLQNPDLPPSAPAGRRDRSRSVRLLAEVTEGIVV